MAKQGIRGSIINISTNGAVRAHRYTSADDVQKAKPFSDIFSLAIRRFRLEGRRPVAVGDTPYDIAAAHPVKKVIANGRIFDIADVRHRARVVDAVSGGAPMGYWFGNFCVIGSRPARSAFLRINRAKGRPDEQPGSVVTTSERLARMFDWSLLPGGVDRGAVVAALDALVGLGPIGMRGPATDTIPGHLSAWDGGVRTVQVVLPGRSCPSNVLVDELLDRIGGDVIFGTSANVSKVRTGRVTASHTTAALPRSQRTIISWPRASPR